jgi:hypothetical protein
MANDIAMQPMPPPSESGAPSHVTVRTMTERRAKA